MHVLCAAIPRGAKQHAVTDQRYPSRPITPRSSEQRSPVTVARKLLGLFAKPIDLAQVYPPDKRREVASQLMAAKAFHITSAAPRETRKQKRFKTPDGPVYRAVIFRDWVVQGRAGDQTEVELVLNDEDRLIFGRCGCAFFREHILGQGPCEHLLALLLCAQPQRHDGASSVTLDKDAFQPPRAAAPIDHELDDTEDSDDDA